MDPHDPNYPPGLSPQLDPTITPQAAPNAAPPPGLFSTASQSYLMGQHDMRLQSHDIAAGYAVGTLTGAAEISMRAAQLYGFHSSIAGQAAEFYEGRAAQARTLAASSTGEAARAARLQATHAAESAARMQRMQRSMALFDPFAQGTAAFRGVEAAGSAVGRLPGAAQAGRAASYIPGAARAGRVAFGALKYGAAIGTGGASFLATEGLIQSVGQMYEGHAERMRSATLINETAGMSGVSYSQAEAKSAQMGQMASSMGMEFEEFSGLTNMLAQGGNFQGVSNLQEFKAKLRGSLQQLKQIAEVTNSTLQEAGQIGMALNQQGFRGNQIPAAASQAFGLGQATGLGAGAFVQMGQIGAQYGASTNIGMARGSSIFQQALGDVELGMQRGAFSPEMIQRLGGSSSSATMALMQGTMGQAAMMGTTVSQMMGFIAKKGEGQYSSPTIDSERLERLLNGNVTRQELAAVSQSQQVLGMSTAVQRAAMPQINQMLHATLSSDTSSPEEYLRKAEMMGIPPDVARMVMETERNRDLTNASTRLAVGQNMAQQSVARSERTSGFVGRMFSGQDMGFGLGAAMNNFGSNLSGGYDTLVRSRRETPLDYTPTAAGRALMVSDRGMSSIMGGRFDSLARTDIVDPNSGSGNFLREGEGERRREALYREFESLYRRADRTSADSSETGVFGEGSFLQGRRLVDRETIQRVVADRETYRPSERAVNRAKFQFGSGRMNVRDIMASVELSPQEGMFDRPKREELLALGMAQKLQIEAPPGMNFREVALKLANGEELTPRETEGLQMIRGRVHSTAAAAGFDAQQFIGAEITGLSGFGGMSMAALNKASADTIFRVVGTNQANQLVQGRGFTRVLGALGEAIGGEAGRAFGVFFGLAPELVLGGSGDERRAFQEFLESEGGVNKLVELRDMLGENASDADIEAAIGDLGFEGEDLINAVFSYARGGGKVSGFNELDKLIGINANREYRRVVDPIARGIGQQAASAFADSTDVFGTAARATLTAFGEANTSARTRTGLIQGLMHAGLVGDDSLLGEARRLREAGLNDVARLFNSVEVLAGGNSAAIQSAGLGQFEELKGKSRQEIIQGLGEAGMFTGAAGAQAQAAAGRGGLEGRSLAGDLLAFSQRVDDLAGVVLELQRNAGLVPAENPPQVSDDGELAPVAEPTNM